MTQIPIDFSPRCLRIAAASALTVFAVFSSGEAGASLAIQVSSCTAAPYNFLRNGLRAIVCGSPRTVYVLDPSVRASSGWTTVGRSVTNGSGIFCAVGHGALQQSRMSPAAFSSDLTTTGASTGNNFPPSGPTRSFAGLPGSGYNVVYVSCQQDSGGTTPGGFSTSSPSPDPAPSTPDPAPSTPDPAPSNPEQETEPGYDNNEGD